MSDATLHATAQDPDDFAVQIADQIESFLVAVTEVAKGDEPDSAVPFLLLEVSQLLLAGGRLGAHEDIVPDERYEPDLGPEPDVDELRENLARLLDPIDVYSEVFDPYEPRKAPVAGPYLRRPGRRRRRPAPRHGPLPRGPHHGGPVVVAVLLLLQLGLHGVGDPARPAVPGGPCPPEPAPGGTGRPGHRPGDGDETLEFEAGKVMAEEIGARWGSKQG